MNSVMQSEEGLARRSFLLRGLACVVGVVALPARVAAQTPLSVSLADYGGVPGASSSTLINAFNSAYAALKANGGGTLTIPPGTYNLGSYGSNTYATNAIGMNNVLISGYGATLTITTTTAAVPAILHFQNCNNITKTNQTKTNPNNKKTNNKKNTKNKQTENTNTNNSFKVVDCTATSVVS